MHVKTLDELVWSLIFHQLKQKLRILTTGRFASFNRWEGEVEGVTIAKHHAMKHVLDVRHTCGSCTFPSINITTRSSWCRLSPLVAHCTLEVKLTRHERHQSVKHQATHPNELLHLPFSLELKNHTPGTLLSCDMLPTRPQLLSILELDYTLKKFCRNNTVKARGQDNPIRTPIDEQPSLKG